MKCIVCQKPNSQWMLYKQTTATYSICSYLCYKQHGPVPMKYVTNIHEFVKDPLPFVNWNDILGTKQTFSIKDEIELSHMTESQRQSYYQRLQDEKDYALDSESESE